MALRLRILGSRALPCLCSRTYANPFVGSFFARRAKKDPTKEEKYHAAAG
jgi:hypothetical protein